MNNFKLILILTCMLTCMATAQDIPTDTTKLEDRSKGQRLKVFNSRGVKIGKVFNRTREPKILVDTVRMDTGYAELLLSSSFSSGRHNVAPSTINHIWPFATQILDSIDAPRYHYGIEVTSRGRKLRIKSNSNADSSLVAIMAIIN